MKFHKIFWGGLAIALFASSLYGAIFHPAIFDYSPQKIITYLYMSWFFCTLCLCGAIASPSKKYNHPVNKKAETTFLTLGGYCLISMLLSFSCSLFYSGPLYSESSLPRTRLFNLTVSFQPFIAISITITLYYFYINRLKDTFSKYKHDNKNRFSNPTLENLHLSYLPYLPALGFISFILISTLAVLLGIFLNNLPVFLSTFALSITIAAIFYLAEIFIIYFRVNCPTCSARLARYKNGKYMPINHFYNRLYNGKKCAYCH